MAFICRTPLHWPVCLYLELRWLFFDGNNDHSNVGHQSENCRNDNKSINRLRHNQCVCVNINHFSVCLFRCHHLPKNFRPAQFRLRPPLPNWDALVIRLLRDVLWFEKDPFSPSCSLLSYFSTRSGSSHTYLLEFLEHGGVLCLQELCVSPSGSELDKLWALQVLSCVANAGIRYKETICECYGKFYFIQK